MFLDPLHASSQPPDPRQYYTRIPRHGRPRRLDAILIRQQIPNIPWTYYDTIQMPISDHALVLLGVRWRIGVPDPPRRKPQPTVAKWYTKQYQRFTNTISTLSVTNNDPPLRTARRILSAIAHAARPRRPTRAQTATTASWSETTDPKTRLREYGEIQEQHIRRQIGKLRRAAVHKSGYFYKMVKRWRTGLIAQDTPQPPNRRNTVRTQPLCGRPNIRRRRVPATHTETCTAPHVEHNDPHIRGVLAVTSGTKEQICRT